MLRLDDRGVGSSSGDLTNDVLAGIAFLKDRPDIDSTRIGLFGHSEGGYLAPLVAERSHEVAFVIMMAGPAVSGEAVLVRQNQLIFKNAGLPQAQLAAQVAYVEKLSALLREKTTGRRTLSLEPA